MVWNCPFCILRGCWSYNINLLSQVESGEKKSEQFDITWKTMHRFRKTKFLSVKLLIFSYPSVLTLVLGAQKNRLIETVLLSTHNICFG